MEKLLTESEKVEQLMRPRYKVLIEFPGSPFNVGNILYQQSDDETLFQAHSTTRRIPPNVRHPDYYPEVFRKLEWWEERTPEEMPDYVKWVMWNEPQIEKVNSWRLHGKIPYTDVPSQVNSIRAEYFEPATSSEYNEYTASRL